VTITDLARKVLPIVHRKQYCNVSKPQVCLYAYVLLAGTLKCLLRDERGGTRWELAAVPLGTARLEHLLADSSCSTAYVFSRWTWRECGGAETYGTAAPTEDKKESINCCDNCNVLAKPFLQLADRKCNVCKISCLVHQDFVLPFFIIFFLSMSLALYYVFFIFWGTR
jgi:hypothetical protein